MTTTDKIHQTLRDSAGMRWLVLLLLAFAMFCSYIFMDILSPIKDLMQSTRGWDSTAFGTMQGSETFLNVFVFSSSSRVLSSIKWGTLYSNPFRSCDACRSYHQLVCGDGCFSGKRASNLVYRQSELYSRFR